MQIPFNNLSTPVNVQSHDDSFHNSKDTANSNLISEDNGSHTAKTVEITLNDLKQSILKDLKKQYPPTTHGFNSTISKVWKVKYNS